MWFFFYRRVPRPASWIIVLVSWTVVGFDSWHVSHFLSCMRSRVRAARSDSLVKCLPHTAVTITEVPLAVTIFVLRPISACTKKASQ